MTCLPWRPVERLGAAQGLATRRGRLYASVATACRRWSRHGLTACHRWSQAAPTTATSSSGRKRSDRRTGNTPRPINSIRRWLSRNILITRVLRVMTALGMRRICERAAMSRRLPGNDATPVGVFTPYPTETTDDKTRDQTDPAGTRGQPEPQGPRQRAPSSSRHHQWAIATTRNRTSASRAITGIWCRIRATGGAKVRSGRHSGARAARPDS